MGVVVKRLIWWAIACALLAVIVGSGYYVWKAHDAGYELSGLPPLKVALDYMRLHHLAALGAAGGVMLGLLALLIAILRRLLTTFFDRKPRVQDAPDPDALIRAERAERADAYLSTLQTRSLDHVAVATEDTAEGPDVENVITARDGRFTYRILAYRHLTHEERVEVVSKALELGHVEEPEPGGTATVITSIGK